MALSSIKFAEKLIILKEVGQGVLERVHAVKRQFTSGTKPSFFVDPQLKKLLEVIAKKFPDFEPSVEKTPGYDLFLSKAKQLYEELEGPYYALVDAFEFKEAALVVLNEVASGTVEMKLDENPTLTAHFLDLFCFYAQNNILVSMIEERKPLLAAFQKLYYHIKCTNEPSYQRVGNYINQFEIPIKVMQDEFKSLSASLGKTLVNFVPLVTRLKQIQQLRKEGAFNIALKPEDMAKPITDKFRFQAAYFSQIYLWMMYGFLLCPESLGLPGAVELLVSVLKDGFLVPVFKDISIPVHPEYINLFKNYKSTNKNLNLSKSKKMISEAAEECGAKGGASRKQRRIFLRQEMSILHKLLVDKPGLLGPKFQMVISLLSLAKEEVLWYFRHNGVVPPKAVAKKFVEDDFKDNRISELIYLIDAFVTLIRTHKKIVQQYHAEYLRGADYNRISELVDNNFLTLVGNGPSQICRAVVDDLASANENSSFKVLRLNWLRAESALCSIQSPVPIGKIKEAVDRFNLIENHSRFVDEIDDLLDKYASLKVLYYYKDSFLNVFDRAIKDGPNQPLHALSFIKLLAEFPSLITQHIADEREAIGRDCANMADKLVADTATRISALLNEVAKQNIIFDSRLAEVNAAYPLILKNNTKAPPKDLVLPETPGVESDYKRRPELDRLRLYERNAWQLCSILGDIEAITVYDQKLCPREYLRERLADAFRKFLRGAIATEIRDDKHVERVLQRPSVYERQIYVYLSTIKLVEDFVDLDLGEMAHEVMLSEMWIPACGKTGTFDYVTVDDTDFKYEALGGTKVIGTIVSWYAEFITKKLAIPGICYAAPRRGFVSRTGLAFRAEYFADIEELKALVRLIGPYGVRLIDREALKYILSNVNGVKESLAFNKSALEELATNYINESSYLEIIKKMKDVDSFVNRSVLIGNTLYFRDILRESLKQTVDEKIPYVLSAVRGIFKQYKRNTYLTLDLLAADALAYDCGLEMGTADQGLKRMLVKAFTSTDIALVNVLPFMYAAAFTSTTWKEASYKPLIEAHTNNANALAKCINSLIVAAKSITSVERNETEINQLLKAFIEVSSVILLRIARSKPDKHTPQDFSSVIIFLDRFVQESPMLTRDMLEENLPYILLRNHWKSIYTPRTKKSTEVAAVDVF